MYQFSKAAFESQERFAVQRWDYVEDSNFVSMVDYINWLFEQRSRLLVIRLDLAFRAGTQGQYDAEYARECFQRLLNNRRRNRIFRNLIGYIWAFEYGQDKGFHYHCIFFYDGHLSQQDITIGHEIGGYWRDVITENTGCFYCSNDQKDMLAKRGYPIGVGMIHRHDMILREDLIWIATYLLKEPEEGQPQLRSVLPESLRRFRAFGHGEVRN